MTKDYAEFGDTTSEGFKEISVPVLKYDQGHNAPPFIFTYAVRKTISNGGSLDISGDYIKTGGLPITITKISNGNFVMDNAFNFPRITPAIVYVDASNKITIPDVKTGYYGGNSGFLTIRQAQFYNIRYSQVGSVPGAGDTLFYTVKRTDIAGALTKLIRQ